jgi:hypothetical protein
VTSSCHSPTRHLVVGESSAAGATLESLNDPEETVSEILLTILAEALGAALVALVMTALRRAAGAAYA